MSDCIIIIVVRKWARSLAGKALRSQRRDREFKSLRVHHMNDGMSFEHFL